MRTASDIQRLCESWWEKLSDSTRDDHHHYAELYLTRLGWRESHDAEPVAVPGQPTTLAYVIRAAGRAPLATYFVLPGVLEPPSAVLKRGLDYCTTTRALVDNNRFFSADYAFITDLFRSYLYDAKNDDLLLYSDTPSVHAEEFGDVLTKANVEGGGLDDVRRQPRSYVARQLREWLRRWCETLCVDWQAPEDAAWLAMDRLLTLRFMAEQDAKRKPGWHPAQQFENLMQAASQGVVTGMGRQLTHLFELIHREWGNELFSPEPPLEAILEQDALAAPLLREMGLLSRTKFTIPTVLESFNFGEASEKARVRMIPEENAERQLYLAQRTYNDIDETRIEIDVADEGYRAVMHWLDRLIDTYDRIAFEFDSAAVPGAPTPKDLDLFGWSEMDSQRPRALTERMHHAIENGLVVYCATPRQFRTARLVLYLYLIDRFEKEKSRFRGLPRVEAALHRRPRMLETDRRLIFQPIREAEWEVM